jgi:hypothetical protein
MTNPGKGHLPQTKPHTAKAEWLKLRGIYENASGDDGAVTTRILNQLESHPRQHHRDLADHLRGRRRRKTRASMPFSLGRYRAPSIIKALTQSIPSCAVWRRSRRKEADGQNPKRANRTIFKTRKEAPPGRCLASKTVTGIVTDDPKHTKAIVEQLLRALGRPPSGHKHGRRRAMLALIIRGAGRRLSNWKRDDLATRPWLHNSINDKAALIAASTNWPTGNPGLIPFQTVKMLPDDLKGAALYHHVGHRHHPGREPDHPLVQRQRRHHRHQSTGQWDC